LASVKNLYPFREKTSFGFRPGPQLPLEDSTAVTFYARCHQFSVPRHFFENPAGPGRLFPCSRQQPTPLSSLFFLHRIPEVRDNGGTSITSASALLNISVDASLAFVLKRGLIRFFNSCYFLRSNFNFMFQMIRHFVKRKKNLPAREGHG